MKNEKAPEIEKDKEEIAQSKLNLKIEIPENTTRLMSNEQYEAILNEIKDLRTYITQKEIATSHQLKKIDLIEEEIKAQEGFFSPLKHRNEVV